MLHRFITQEELEDKKTLDRIEKVAKLNFYQKGKYYICASKCQYVDGVLGLDMVLKHGEEIKNK